MTETDEIREALRAHPFGNCIGEEAIDRLAPCAHFERFEAGTFIFREGEDAHCFYVMTRGIVGLEIHNPAGDVRTIQTIDEDDILGISWLFEPHRWMFDAHVIQDVTAIALPAECVRDACDEEPALGYAIMEQFARVIIERLQATRIQLLDVYG
jgi:CRP-like cAMP-binding protein